MKNCEKDFEKFKELAKRLLSLADRLDEQCTTQAEKDKLAIIYQEFLAEFMK